MGKPLGVLSLVATVATGSLLLSACGSNPTTSSSGGTKTFTIPVIIPLTGAGAEYGLGDQVGMQVALNQINQAGGIDGYHLAAQVYDDASDPTKAAQIMHGIVGSSLVVLGPNLSTTCLSAFPIANAAGVPTVSSSVSDGTILAGNRPWTFDVFIPANDLEPPAASKWLAITHAKTVVAIVDQNQTAATAQATSLLNALQSDGVKVLKTIYVSENEATYSAEADAAAALHPDGLVVSGYPDTAGAVVKALRAAGQNQSILFTTTSVTQDSLQVGGSAMTNGWVMLESWPGVGGPTVQAFDKAYEKMDKGLTPEPTAPFMYDSVYLIANALKSSGVLTSNASLSAKRLALRKALAKTSVTGATGNWTMTPSGIRSGSGLWVQVKNDAVVQASN